MSESGLKMGRRTFLKVLAVGSALGIGGCLKGGEKKLEKGAPKAGTGAGVKPAAVKEIYAACSYCGVGCGTIYQVKNERVVGNKPDPDHPTNEGVQCVKGLVLWEPLTEEGAYKPVWNERGAGGQKGRLTKPLIRDDPSKKGTFDGFREATWEEALDYAARRLNEIKRRYGGNAIGYVGSGQLSLEDQYITNKIYKGVLGSDSIEANARMCMTSAVAGYFGTLGSDMPPTCYEDIMYTDLVVDIGHNFRASHPVLYWRILEQVRKRGIPVVIVDPRRTGTVKACEDINPEKTIHLQVMPNQDVALLNSIGYVLVHELKAVHPNVYDFVEKETVDKYIEGVKKYNPDKIADSLSAVPGGVTPEKIRRVARLIRDSMDVNGGNGYLTFWGIGYNQSTHGVPRTRSIINLHLITGSIGRPGAGPFSMTGQPNAMGERFNGGLTNGLPPMPVWGSIKNEEARKRVAKVWGISPDQITKESNKGMLIGILVRALAASRGITVREAREQVGLVEGPGHRAEFNYFGKIDNDPPLRALWLAYTTHVHMPDQENLVRPALKGIFVIASDIYPNAPNLLYADVVFPAATNGEARGKWWGTYIQSERRLYIIEGGITPPGEAKPDLDIAIELGKRLDGGKNMFNYPLTESGEYDPEAVFRELQAVTKGTIMDISGIEGYEQIKRLKGIMLPAPTPEIAAKGGIKRRYMGQEKEYGWAPPYPGAGIFPTKSGKAKIHFYDQGLFKWENKRLLWSGGPAAPIEIPDTEYVGVPPEKMPRDKWPYWCNLGIVYEHFHSSKTIRSKTLRRLVGEQYVEINPEDARAMGISDGDVVRVVSPRGYVTCRASVGINSKVGPGRNEPPRGSVFMPWNLSVADSAVPTKNKWLTNALSRCDYDPISGQSDYKHGVCRIEKV